jgi:hypothetical protein
MTDSFGFVEATSSKPTRFRRRAGRITALESGHRVSVQIAGDSSTTVTGVRYMGSVPPAVGSMVFLETNGKDLVVSGSVAGTGSANVPLLWVYRNAAVNIATGAAYTAIQFDAEQVDTHSMFTPTSANITIPMDGTYLFSCNFGYAANSAGYRTGYLVNTTAGTGLMLNQIDGLATNITSLSLVAVATCTKGDTIQLQTRQTSGGLLALYAGAPYATSVRIAYLGPSA